MVEKKNKITITIESCNQCPNMTLKFNRETEDDDMFCQTATSCIKLRESWGYHPIPDWCPRLNHMMSPKRTYCEKEQKFRVL